MNLKHIIVQSPKIATSSRMMIEEFMIVDISRMKIC